MLRQQHNEYVSFSLAQQLLYHGADVNAQDKSNVTALHLAMDQWELQVPQLLVDHGANISIKNDRDMTPLHLLLEGNSFRIFFNIHSYYSSMALTRMHKI